MQLKQFPEKSKFKRLAKDCNVIPLCVEILADMETPVSLLNKIYNQKDPVFLFESVEGGERWGRYSFIGTSARWNIRIFQNFVEISENGLKQKIPHHKKPLTILRNFMKQFKPAEGSELPRFWGGMVGYLTYEMVSFFEAIPNRLPKKQPLAHFIIPDKLLIFDNLRHTLLAVVVAFIKPEHTIEEIYFKSRAQIQSLMAQIEKPFDTKLKPNFNSVEKSYPIESEWDEETYRSRVDKVKTYIKAGDVIQTVISQPFTCRSPVNLLSLYRAQRYINPSPYLFFLNLDKVSLAGSSPETMVRLENGVATLRPIAGTRPRGKNEKEDGKNADELLKDEKERAEHLMLVDLGRNDLGRVALTGTVQVTELMVIEKYSHVMHLVSNIRCDLKSECDALSLLESVFPAGTLSGAPKVRAMEIISKLEKEPRGPYGGAVGYISFNGNMDMAITIRTACLENGKLTVRAGAGIVADSNREKERVETVDKAMAIQKALELVHNQNL